MTHSEALQDILRCIGGLTFGKERWFPNNGVWYDKLDGKLISTEEMTMRVCTELSEKLKEK